jgi:transcriptional regulator with XRE-family HTH domain
LGVDLAERISTLRRVNGLSARQLAALVDVAPTTVTRIESGAVSPSFDLAKEILTVLGEPIGFTGLADVDAIVAARLALDPELDVSSTPGVELWRQRWARIGLLDADGRVAAGKEADLLFRAGRAARLTRRPGAVDFTAGCPRIRSLTRFARHGSTTRSPAMPEPTDTGRARGRLGRFSTSRTSLVPPKPPASRARSPARMACASASSRSTG